MVIGASPFCQAAANSAILDACKDDAEVFEVHLLDLGMGMGLQWPALIQAMVVRKCGLMRVTLTGIEGRHDQ